MPGGGGDPAGQSLAIQVSSGASASDEAVSDARPTGDVPTVFLDRDGTLIEDRGHLRSPDEVVFYPATVPALRRLQPHFRLFIVTNQSGVSKGEVTPDDVQRVNDHVASRLRDAGIEIAAVYCCPHQRADGCACIKPKPFFLELAVREHGVDLRRSFAVGDHPHDVHFARNAGATGIFVLTGHGAKHRDELDATDIVAKDIGAAVEIILHATARCGCTHGLSRSPPQSCSPTPRTTGSSRR